MVVISNLYLTVANVDEEENNTELLQVMLNGISIVNDDPDALRIKDGIAAWIEARKSYGSGESDSALEHYNTALSQGLRQSHDALLESQGLCGHLSSIRMSLKLIWMPRSERRNRLPWILARPLRRHPVPVSSTPDPTTAQATQAASTFSGFHTGLQRETTLNTHSDRRHLSENPRQHPVRHLLPSSQQCVCSAQ